jgi:hypothetical protein
MDQMTVITLTPWEYQHASNIGIARFAANWESINAKHYKQERMQDDRTAQVAATICEIAVAKATNRYWSGSVWSAKDHQKYKSIADVGKNIEVRRSRNNNTVAVRKHQLGKNLVLFGAYAIPEEFRQVEIWGWLNYDKAWELGYASEYDQENTRLINKDLFNELESK